MKRIATALLVLTTATTAIAADCSKRFFTIEKSTNKNIVVYDAKINGTALDTKSPVVAYWIMNESGGHKEDLTFVERSKAFGFDLQQAEGGYKVSIVSMKQKPFIVSLEDGCAVARADIAGKPGKITKMFVQMKEGAFLPKVEFVMLYGVRDNGEKVTEKLIP